MEYFQLNKELYYTCEDILSPSINFKIVDNFFINNNIILKTKIPEYYIPIVFYLLKLILSKKTKSIFSILKNFNDEIDLINDIKSMNNEELKEFSEDNPFINVLKIKDFDYNRYFDLNILDLNIGYYLELNRKLKYSDESELQNVSIPLFLKYLGITLYSTNIIASEKIPSLKNLFEMDMDQNILMISEINYDTTIKKERATGKYVLFK